MEVVRMEAGSGGWEWRLGAEVVRMEARYMYF